MSQRTIEYAASFSLRREHEFRFRRLGRLFSDTFDVFVDTQQVLSIQMGWWASDMSLLKEHSHRFAIDETPVELVWKWSKWFGDPDYVVLRSDDAVLARYDAADDPEATPVVLRSLVNRVADALRMRRR